MTMILGLTKDTYYDIEEVQREFNIKIIQGEHWSKHYGTCSIILANRVIIATDPTDEGCNSITLYYENFNNPILKLKPAEFVKIEIK